MIGYKFYNMSQPVNVLYEKQLDGSQCIKTTLYVGLGEIFEINPGKYDYELEDLEDVNFRDGDHSTLNSIDFTLCGGIRVEIEKCSYLRISGDPDVAAKIGKLLRAGKTPDEISKLI